MPPTIRSRGTGSVESASWDAALAQAPERCERQRLIGSFRRGTDRRPAISLKFPDQTIVPPRRFARSSDRRLNGGRIHDVVSTKFLGKKRDHARDEFPIFCYLQDAAIGQRLIEIVFSAQSGQADKPNCMSKNRVDRDLPRWAPVFVLHVFRGASPVLVFCGSEGAVEATAP